MLNQESSSVWSACGTDGVATDEWSLTTGSSKILRTQLRHTCNLIMGDASEALIREESHKWISTGYRTS